MRLGHDAHTGPMGAWRSVRQYLGLERVQPSHGNGIPDPRSSHTEIRYDSGWRIPKWALVAGLVGAVGALLSYLLSLWFGSPRSTYQVLAPMAVMVVALPFLARPRGAIVTAEEVRAPFVGLLPWSQVCAIQEPTPLDDRVIVRLRSGRTKGIPLPATYAAEVAAIGRVPLAAREFKALSFAVGTAAASPEKCRFADRMRLR